LSLFIYPLQHTSLLVVNQSYPPFHKFSLTPNFPFHHFHVENIPFTATYLRSFIHRTVPVLCYSVLVSLIQLLSLYVTYITKHITVIQLPSWLPQL
jgi:hypothetical protein